MPDEYIADLVMKIVDGRRRQGKARPRHRGLAGGSASAMMEKRLERIIVTLRLTVVQHHARTHLAPPPVVAKPVLPVVS
jgi:hypothetical protein